MNILLLNGHGGSNPYDSGAVGCGYKEAELVRECTDRVESELRNYANVYRYPRERNAYQDISSGVFKSILEKTFPGVKFNYAFERHFNASDGAGRGSECFVTSLEKGITVEQNIMKKMSKYFKLRDNDAIFDGVKRTNFKVIKTLKNMGISGALLETCFIDNQADMDIWKANKESIDKDIAIAIAEGFGLVKGSSVAPQPTPQPTPQPAQKPSNYDQWVADLQNELNKQGFKDYEGKSLVVDGINGERTKSACPQVKKGAKGNITRLIQKRLVSVGFSLNIDGDFGTNTKEKVKKFQANRELTQDGIVGRNTWDWLLKGTKM